MFIEIPSTKSLFIQLTFKYSFKAFLVYSLSEDFQEPFLSFFQMDLQSKFLPHAHRRTTSKGASSTSHPMRTHSASLKNVSSLHLQAAACLKEALGGRAGWRHGHVCLEDLTPSIPLPSHFSTSSLAELGFHALPVSPTITTNVASCRLWPHPSRLLEVPVWIGLAAESTQQQKHYTGFIRDTWRCCLYWLPHVNIIQSEIHRRIRFSVTQTRPLVSPCNGSLLIIG